VAEPSAPGASYIPNTKIELAHIQHHLYSRDHTVFEGPDATKENVLREMEDCNWVHFACHGVQNPIEPTKSALLLHDARLSLEEIIRLNLPKAEFAFLSACQTITGDESISEEAAHIAGGMLLSGYRSVVATMWSIQDDLAPKVTDEFYARIMRDMKRPSSRNAAEALHYSVQKLRQGENVTLTSWIPFVHVGI
jgi:CHAT domain-containing protein